MKTTREEAREKSHDELVDNLQELLEKNYDAEKGFKNALENSENPHLKNFFKSMALQKNKFATELDHLIRTLNAKPIEKGSTSGKLHRTWMDLKTALSSNKDESVLEECIRGEKASEEEYEDKLKDNLFPPEVNQVLNRHLNEIRNTIAEVKTLEDLQENRE